MRQIHKVVATVRYTPEQLQTMREIFSDSVFVHVDDADTPRLLTELQDADVAVLDADLDDRVLQGKALRWIHCSHAGLNRSARPEIFERGILLSGSAGRSAPVLAEHCVYFMLQACYHTRELLEAQREHRWGIPEMADWRGLHGRTAGIIGMGHNGRMLAERLRAMEMKLITYDRYDVAGFDYVSRKLNASRGDTLEELYQQSDFVVLCIALTDQTYHLLDDAAFAKMKRGAVLVNMARGAVVDTQAMIRALDSGQLSTACLDVFETEPLPPDSPLWDRRDVYITPHATPPVADRDGRSLEILRENARRYRAGEPLLNLITPEDRYTHS